MKRPLPVTSVDAIADPAEEQALLHRMKTSLIDLVLNNARQMQVFALDPERCPPAYRDRFEHMALVRGNDECFERAIVTFRALDAAAMKDIWPRLRARLEQKLDLYLDKNDHFTLQLPERWIAHRGAAPELEGEDRIYQAAVDLFYATHLDPTEARFDTVEADLPERAMPQGIYRDCWFSFAELDGLRQAVNYLLPSGLRVLSTGKQSIQH